MNIQEMINYQYRFDQYLNAGLKARDPQFDVYSHDSLMKLEFAFKVEVCELANEVGFFKMWKTNHVVNREKVLEEWADGMHILLAYGIGRGFASDINDTNEHSQIIEDEEMASYIFYQIMEDSINTPLMFVETVLKYILLGHLLNFTDEQLEASFYSKGEINLTRQMEGY